MKFFYLLANGEIVHGEADGLSETPEHIGEQNVIAAIRATYGWGAERKILRQVHEAAKAEEEMAE